MTSSGDHSSHSFDTLQSSTSDQEGTSDGPDEAVMFSSSSSDEVEEFNVLHPHLTRKILQARKKRPKHSAYVFALGAILTTAFTTMFCSAEDQISGTSLSTGVVLVALGLPSLLVKLFLMFQRLPQIPSIFGCFVFLLLGLALNLSSVLLTRVVGLCMVSLGTGLGEVNVHAGINAEMTKKAYSTFLGGTGVAGVLGGLVYVGKTTITFELYETQIPHEFACSVYSSARLSLAKKRVPACVVKLRLVFTCDTSTSTTLSKHSIPTERLTSNASIKISNSFVLLVLVLGLSKDVN